MKEFWCGAVVPNCSSRFRGRSEEEILNQVADHAAHDHGLAAVPPELVQKVREHIRESE